MQRIPKYSELPLLGDTGERSAWGVFGPDDQFGCLNFLSPQKVAEAAKLIRSGKTISLDLPLGEPQPQFWAMRPPLQHQVRVHRHGRDDQLNEFNLQGSTQWDGLRHVRFRQFGYYGGNDEAELDSSGTLGVDRWAERGIFGRGVLIDAARYFASQGRTLDPTEELAIDSEAMDAILEHQRVALREGDILIVRTGWVRWYTSLSIEERDAIVARYQADRSSFHAPGVEAGLETCAWLWDQRIAAIATDTPTFEVLPYVPARGWAHHRMLALLGLPLGELWALEELADYCAANPASYAFFLSSAPLKLRKGVGTPANAYAIF